MAAPRDLGLGYFGQWGALPVVVASIVSWAALPVFALLWMRRFPQGPLEYVLAWMTGKNARRDQH